MSSAPETKGYLGDVEQTLSAALADATPEGQPPGDMIMTAARHLCVGGGGKRIRPLLVHHFGAALGLDAARLVEVGAAAELIHSASLLHDDVVDAGMFRRGRPTVNSLWGNVVAVMTGDMVLTVALQRLAALDVRLTQDALGCVAEMTRGTIAELEARGDLDLPLERMRMIADGKTGALFAFCGIGAARVARDDAAAAAFEEFGRRLGIAFQIADDIKDLDGRDEGKPQFADLASRTPSLPVLLAARADEGVKRRILEGWSFGEMRAERLRELGAAVVGTGALDEAVTMMKAEVRAALEVFGPYAATVGGAELTSWARQLEAAFDDRGAHEGHPVDGSQAAREQRAI
jgi:heptaprenyl diphosphate synthase